MKTFSLAVLLFVFSKSYAQYGAEWWPTRNYILKFNKIGFQGVLQLPENFDIALGGFCICDRNEELILFGSMRKIYDAEMNCLLNNKYRFGSGILVQDILDMNIFHYFYSFYESKDTKLYHIIFDISNKDNYVLSKSEISVKKRISNIWAIPDYKNKRIFVLSFFYETSEAEIYEIKGDKMILRGVCDAGITISLTEYNHLCRDSYENYYYLREKQVFKFNFDFENINLINCGLVCSNVYDFAVSESGKYLIIFNGSTVLRYDVSKKDNSPEVVKEFAYDYEYNLLTMKLAADGNIYLIRDNGKIDCIKNPENNKIVYMEKILEIPPSKYSNMKCYCPNQLFHDMAIYCKMKTPSIKVCD